MANKILRIYVSNAKAARNIVIQVSGLFYIIIESLKYKTKKTPTLATFFVINPSSKPSTLFQIVSFGAKLLDELRESLSINLVISDLFSDFKEFTSPKLKPP